MSDIEAAAREIGWKPKEEFKGDVERWVDAQTFISRGENFIPILRADRDRLRNETTALRTGLSETQAALKASQEAIAELKAYQDVHTKRQVELAKATLLKRLKEARADGDVEAEVEIQDELAEIRQVTAAPPPKPAAPVAAPAAPTTASAPDPHFVEWSASNAWFATNTRLRHLTLGVAEELRGKEPNLTGKAFYDRISAEMAPYLESTNTSGSKVDGGGRGASGGGGGGSGGRTKTYNDLPAEAKAACANFASRLVGPGRAYKDLASWQEKYTKDFFESEQQ